jgi:hypothetical protein
VAIPDPLPHGGFAISLRASFLVFKFLPIFGIATNNAAPRLVLFNDRLEFRVIAGRLRRYEDLEYIDALQTFGTQNIILCWRRAFLASAAIWGTKRG